MKWHKRFIELAHHVAQWSKDDSTKVGAVIVDDSNRVISLGYNGPPRRVNDDYENREQKLRRTLHAEVNALAFAHRDVSGCTIYITHPPCAQCAAQIIQHGIRQVVFDLPTYNFLTRWGDDYKESLAMFSEVGVEVAHR